jgi:hypothetical protein
MKIDEILKEESKKAQNVINLTDIFVDVITFDEDGLRKTITAKLGAQSKNRMAKIIIQYCIDNKNLSNEFLENMKKLLK